MDQSAQYGQMDFNLPHDVVSLPSKGIFYKPKKESLKVGFLTAADENLLMSQNTPKEGLITALLRSKIYEPGFDVNQLLDTDVQAILLFLRNTSFGSEYNFTLIDPSNGKPFTGKVLIDEINFETIKNVPDENGKFNFFLPKSKKNVKFKLLNIGETNEVDKIKDSYPQGVIAPIITKKLEKHIIDIDGDTDKLKIATFISQMPISDSKSLRKFISECEPKMDLKRTVIAPSGENVTFDVMFGVEFFRPFFSL
jgi:hypothetical protein